MTPPTKAFSAEQVRSRLAERIAQDGRETTRRALGCSAGQLRHMLLGSRNPSAAVLDLLQLEKCYRTTEG